MRKDIEEKYLSLFKEGESLTQKEVAARLNVTVASASRNLRYFYEKGILRVDQVPGMSMRYFRTENSKLLRSPNGDPLIRLYFPDVSLRDVTEILNELAVALTTTLFKNSEGPARERYQEALSTTVIPAFRRLSLLSEILRDATPEQIKETLATFSQRKKDEGESYF